MVLIRFTMLKFSNKVYRHLLHLIKHLLIYKNLLINVYYLNTMKNVRMNSADEEHAVFEDGVTGLYR